ncbi:hypothetical protein BsWGS_13010 [Bradybaena similaris]
MEPLHKVTTEELPVLLQWTAQYLPDTCKIYGSIYEELNGRWQGPDYYTLGWPEILAVGEGPVDGSKSKCAEFFNDTRHTCVYAPNPEHVEELLRRPEFLDWTKPILFHASDYDSAKIAEKVSNSTGTKYNEFILTEMMAAYPGTVKPRPVPDGFELRQLDPDRDAEYVASTWPLRRNHTVPYVYELLKSFPSLGIFARDGECAAFEVRTEYGTAAILYTRDTFRGRGLASCIISHTAQNFFQENRPIVSSVLPQNTPAMDMHHKLGFKSIGKLCWFVHSMTPETVLYYQDHGFKC